MKCDAPSRLCIFITHNTDGSTTIAAHRASLCFRLSEARPVRALLFRFSSLTVHTAMHKRTF